MTKITKRVVDAAQVREKDYVIWDEELLGFGLRVFASGKRSYIINTGQPAARLATPSASTGFGRPRQHDRKRRSSSAVSLKATILPTSVNSTTKQSPSKSCVRDISPI